MVGPVGIGGGYCLPLAYEFYHLLLRERYGCMSVSHGLHLEVWDLWSFLNV